MRELGVGLVYWSALAPLFESGDAAVLELEPQTLWTKTAASSGFVYQLNESSFESIARLPQPKLLHGVGQPLAGTVDDPLEYIPLLRRMVDRIQPAWVSEHLSFNRIRRRGGVSECGFLLPPAQTEGSARVAANNVRRYARAMDRPVAFETGVNYFRPQAAHLDDGEFFGTVAEQADCGILLDLHNLWCNERNGRQPVRDALLQMPLDRVWEVHLAGGMSLDGIWLDAHSNSTPPELLELAAEVIPRLPNVGALIFEILPEHLHNIGIDGVHRELEALKGLWRTRPPRTIKVRQSSQKAIVPSVADTAETHAWEQRLFEAINGESTDQLAVDPGCAVMARLIRDVRSASLTRGMRYTITALLASLGAEATSEVLSSYFRSTPAEAFVATESYNFARFLSRRRDLIAAIPYLDQILAFEKALLAASLFGESTELHWTADPTLLFETLDTGRLPRGLALLRSQMNVTPA
jgi:uncharacterized protein (UPF0276 family)